MHVFSVMACDSDITGGIVVSVQSYSFVTGFSISAVSS